MNELVTWGFGVAACLASVLMLRTAWRGAGIRRKLWAAGAGLALIPAITLYALWLGAVVGLTAVLLAFSLCALLVVKLGEERRPARLSQPRVRSDKPLGPVERRRTRWRGWARGVAALFLPAIAANAIGAGVAGVVPGAQPDRFAAAVVIVPLLWACLVIWMLSDRVMRRPVLGMTGASVIAGAAIAWTLLS